MIKESIKQKFYAIANELYGDNGYSRKIYQTNGAESAIYLVGISTLYDADIYVDERFGIQRLFLLDPQTSQDIFGCDGPVVTLELCTRESATPTCIMTVFSRVLVKYFPQASLLDQSTDPNAPIPSFSFVV